MKYVEPEIEILKFEKGDVITVSNDENYDPNTGGSDYNAGGWN